MIDFYQVIVPEATTNLITNPSAETNATGYGAGAGVLQRISARSKFGAASINYDPTLATYDGMYYAITLTAATTYTWSFWTFGPYAGSPMRAYVHDVTAGAALANITTYTATGTWQEVVHTFTTSANTSFRLYVTKNNDDTLANYYVDGMQCEAKAYATTFVDMADPPQPGYAWRGARHASTSSRTAQTKSGGRVRNLSDYGVIVESSSGGGMVATEHVSSPYGLLEGAVYQRTRVLPRLLMLSLVIHGTSLADLHTKRRALLALFEPYGAGGEPTIIRYIGGTEPLELSVYYDDGLEGGALIGVGAERAVLRLIADEPFWRNLGTNSLYVQASSDVTDADYILERDQDGIWRALAGGVSATVTATAYHPTTGELYAAGNFVTAYNAAGTGSPVTVNYIARWTGTAWATLNNGMGGVVTAIAFDAAGTLYAGGTFTTCNGAATVCNGLARWDGATWTRVGTGSFAGVQALAVGTDNRLYIGGTTANMDGVADADFIAAWNPTLLVTEALGTGTNNYVYALAVDFAGAVFAGGTFTTAGGGTAKRVARWTPSNATWAPSGFSVWAAVGPGIDNGTVRALALGSDNTLYVGGSFTLTANHPQYIARLMGAGWAPLGSNITLNSDVWDIVSDGNGHLAVGGAFTTAGGRTINDRFATTNGRGGWYPPFVDLPGSATVNAVAYAPNFPADRRLALGFTTSGTAVTSYAIVPAITATNDGSAPAAPVIRITGPGTLEGIVNWTTGKRIDFNLTLNAGEIATLDTRPGKFAFSSTFRPNLLPSITSSHPNSFRLQSGENIILTKIKDATAATAMHIMWNELYLSQDP